MTQSLTHQDCRGLAITASSSEAAELFDDAVSAYCGMRADTADRAARTTQADPSCILGHCLEGYLFMHANRRECAQRAFAKLEQAKAAADSHCANSRERLHIGALEAWHSGDLLRALEAWQQALHDSPLDLLALKLAQFITSYLGNTADIRDSVARVLPAWNESTDGYGFVQGCYAYGLEESGDYAAAEKFGREAVERNPADLWAAHAVTHVSEMDGRPHRGIEWVTEHEQHWQGCSNFVNHVRWHRCLFYLALQQFERVLELYEGEVRPGCGCDYLDIANSSALLWRLEQAGIDVAGRWEELALRAESYVDEHFFVFVDLHYIAALAAGKNNQAVARCLASCASFSAGDGTEARIMADLGLPIAQALLAHRRRNFAEAAALLYPLRNEFRRLGGSHAQRDLFEQLLIDSAFRSGLHEMARALLQERTERRPHDIWSWRSLASDSNNQPAEAAQAELSRVLRRDAAVSATAALRS